MNDRGRMVLEAVIPSDVIERLLRDFLPLRIHLTPTDEDTRWIELEEPERITMVPGRGVRIECAGRLQYTLGGVRLPISIRHLQVLLVPRVVRADGRHRLAFGLRIEEADLGKVPDLIDAGLASFLNRKLTPEDTRMVWPFERQLTRSFGLPDRLEPLDGFHLAVTGGEAWVGRERLGLRIFFGARVSRARPRPTDDRRRAPELPASSS